MQMRVRGLVSLGLLSLAIAGCTETDVVGPPSSIIAPAVRLDSPRQRWDPARYDLSVTIAGSLIPGELITVTATVTALHDSPRTSVIFATPDLDHPSRRGIREETALVSRQDRPVLKGQTGRFQETVIFPEPGYYRILVRVDAGDPEPMFDNGRLLSQGNHNELWLWVSPDGGRLTPSFDRSVFPEGTRIVPGPLSLKPSRSASGPLRIQPASYSGASSFSFSAAWSYAGMRLQGPAVDTVRLVYLDSAVYKPVPNAYVSLLIWDWYEQRYIGGGGYAHTDANGEVELECAYSPYEENEYTFELSNSYAKVTPTLAAQINLEYYGCGGNSGDEVAYNTAAASIHHNVAVFVPASRTFFGVQRAKIDVEYDSGVTGGSYNDGDDKITLGTAVVLNADAPFFQSHEYGHALHEKALGGMPPINESLCDDHTFYFPTDLECALAEGFADFHGIIVGGTNHRSVYEQQTADSGRGAIVEAPVAGFLYDLVDDSTWPGSITETHDSTSYPGLYVAKLLETCEVYVSSTWIQNRGVDHLAYCAETQVDTAITNSAVFFTTRSTDPTNQRESATEPTGWSATKIRASWQENLYGYVLP